MLQPEFWDRITRLISAPRQHAATVDRVLHRWDEGDEDAVVVSLTRSGWLQLQVNGEVRTLPAEAWMAIVKDAEPESHAMHQAAAHKKD